MSIVYSNQHGWFVSHLEYQRNVYLSDLNQAKARLCDSVQATESDSMYKFTMKCFSEMFDIESPFLKDEQFNKLKSQCSNSNGDQRQPILSRKRKKKPTAEVCEESLKLKAKFHLFQQDLHSSAVHASLSAVHYSADNNQTARKAARHVYDTIDKYFGANDGQEWEGDCDGDAMLPFEGENKEDSCVVVNIRNPNTHATHSFVLPPRCQFYNCDIRHLGTPGLNLPTEINPRTPSLDFLPNEIDPRSPRLNHEPSESNPRRPSPLAGLRFDFVLLDPPWSNKFIRRRKRNKVNSSSNWYHTMDCTSSLLCNIPMASLLNEDSLVGVWCTNNKSHIEQLIHHVFPAWEVSYLATWYWIKVTKYNHPVLDFCLAPNSKQPYERLIFATRNPARQAADEPHVSNGNPASRASDECHFSNGNPTSRAAAEPHASDENRASPASDEYHASEGNSASRAADEPRASNENPASRAAADEARVRKWFNLPEEGKLIVSVPSGVHSHKPCLSDILSLYLSPSPSPHCLELFSRSLTPGWSSLGNQVLGFQFEEFYH